MAFVSYLSFLIFHKNYFIRRIYRVAEFFYNPYFKLLDYKKEIIGAAIFGGNLKTIMRKNYEKEQPEKLKIRMWLFLT